MRIIYITLRGLLQSYGVDDCWDDRRTVSCPTKSAVIGMIGAALGLAYGDERLGYLTEHLKISVRQNNTVEKIVDYQIIRAHRTPDKDYMHPPFFIPQRTMTKADGSNDEFKFDKEFKTDKWIPSTPKQRNKEYLAGASFTVFVEGEDNLLQEIHDALLNPVFPLFLGRKGCLPSEPIVGRFIDCCSIEEAWETCDAKDNDMHIVEYDDDGQNEIGTEHFSRRDNIYGNYVYTSRKICRKEIRTRCI